MIANKQGFTLIELVVVLILIGILGAIALPKFRDFTQAGHDASVRQTASTLQSTVIMAKGQHELEGNPGTVTVDGQTVGFNSTNGVTAFPINATGNPLDDTDCDAVMNNLLTPGVTTLGVISSPTGAGAEYASVPDGPECTYTYQKGAFTDRTIFYSAVTGQVTVTIP